MSNASRGASIVCVFLVEGWGLPGVFMLFSTATQLLVTRNSGRRGKPFVDLNLIGGGGGGGGGARRSRVHRNRVTAFGESFAIAQAAQSAAAVVAASVPESSLQQPAAGTS